MKENDASTGLAVLSFAFFVPAGFLLLAILQSGMAGMLTISAGVKIYLSVLAILLAVAGVGLIRRNYYYGYLLASAVAIYFVVSFIASTLTSGAGLFSIALIPAACSVGIVMLLRSRYRQEFGVPQEIIAEDILVEDAKEEVASLEEKPAEEVNQ